jgi:hypothetical protein
MSSSDDTSSSLWMIHIAFPVLLLGAEVVSAPPWPLATSVPGICTPQDWSPLWNFAMPLLSIDGIATNNNVLTAWSMQSN